MTARFDTAEAEAVVLRHFGVSGRASELGGERTQNFRIRTPMGTTFTLKVSDPQESADGTLLESAALQHIEHTAPNIAAPRVVPALTGEGSVFLGAEDGRYLRLLTYLEGTPLSFIDAPTPALRHAIGEAVARLDAALASFDHPFSRQRDLIWDVKNIARLRPSLILIDEKRRPLAEAMLDRFETVARPHIAVLPAQAVHSDMNGQNILVDSDARDRLAGFLDFGDLVHAPRLVDLAGAALLQVRADEDDLQNAADVVRAYHQASPLQDVEIELLLEFMIARCVVNVVVTEFLADRDPANRPYIMKNNPASWMRLERLSSLSRNPFRNPL
ncbi:Ser/Thr protein kinase RdoA (MazF antagonist) [Mycoplana sp. BE70]|uniref:phosphotransferase n=1 Tax=Mycoplana sp. BE70 TaxID=2817775 RepID=UPI0028583B1C|nr:phosphotransferase [Mycoplana sp. BE70]MDR6757143.1 Ser/Thr protein kinase RdoA (MazF antagonist) [Mycoplana sp. BE70]